jgi:hypothetical protein
VQATDAQVRKLMEEMAKHGQVGLASARAGLDRKTGRKYVAAGKLPTELKKPRDWRTREDPFEVDWPAIEARLVEAPELEAKTLFELLLEQPGGAEKYQAGQLRTLQRRIREWRAAHGPDREVFFAQVHAPAAAMQTDFTSTNELQVTIAGVLFAHLLCHVVLPYSNWEWVTVCLSESMLALKRGVQAAVFRLGRVAEWHQTDNSTAATHDIPSGKREFNEEYRALMEHLGMKPRTIEPGQSHQNGDIEAANGAFKRRVEQHLLVRGSRDFASVEEYEAWLQGVAEKANRLREPRIREEVAAMRPVVVERLIEYRELDSRVTPWSTIRVRHNAYSVPSRLVNETVRVRLYEDRLEVFYAGQLQLCVERLKGRNGHRINYRHIIWSLVQKPGAFAQYRYREELFPSLTFRRAYDAFIAKRPARTADLEYLRVLHLAASTVEADVETALKLLLDEKRLESVEQVKALVSPAQTEVPALPVPKVNLAGYDELLHEIRAGVAL